jgi:hypothetical protein
MTKNKELDIIKNETNKTLDCLFGCTFLQRWRGDGNWIGSGYEFLKRIILTAFCAFLRKNAFCAFYAKTQITTNRIAKGKEKARKPARTRTNDLPI